MATPKITQRDYFGMIIELAQENGRTDLVDFCNGRIAQLDKKASGGSGNRKSAITDENKALVLNALGTFDGATCTDIANATGLGSTQKVRPILSALVSDGVAKNYKEKGKSLYALA